MAYSNKLFDMSETTIQKKKETCLTCDHRQRWQCNSKVFQYCGVRKSNRTNNGLLKIKCKNEACGMYKKILKI